MTELEVACVPAADGWICQVTVSDENGTRTEHGVSVTREEREHYGAGTEVHLLVDASFRFLLERESKESILRQFALSDIERYFAEFPGVIAARPGR
jgi:hypothetical protein